MHSASDFGYSIAGQLPSTEEPNIIRHGKHAGYAILQNEDGFYWKHGGYCESVEQIKAEIDDHNAEEREHDPAWPPMDTPSLGAPWWSQR